MEKEIQMTQPNPDPYFIDFPARLQRIQHEMARRGVDVYLGSRLRTLSWTLDAFCPWRSYVSSRRKVCRSPITFVIDASRVADELLAGRRSRAGLCPDGRAGPGQRAV